MRLGPPVVLGLSAAAPFCICGNANRSGVYYYISPYMQTRGPGTMRLGSPESATHEVPFRADSLCFRRMWFFGQHNRPTRQDPNQQPGHVAFTCLPLVGSRLYNSMQPSTIQAVDRHCSAPDKGFGQTHAFRIERAG